MLKPNQVRIKIVDGYLKGYDIYVCQDIDDKPIWTGDRIEFNWQQDRVRATLAYCDSCHMVVIKDIETKQHRLSLDSEPFYNLDIKKHMVMKIGKKKTKRDNSIAVDCGFED